jgi:hypothetical protein
MSRLISFAILVLLIINPGFLTAGTPTITIIYPTNGAKLTNRTMNVSGTTSEISDQWLQSAQEDFIRGTMENTTVNSRGEVVLDGGIYDDFNDNSLDETRWTRYNETCGIRAVENHGVYNASGTGNYSGYDVCRCITLSTLRFKNQFSADLIVYPWNNSYTGGAFIGVYIDPENYLLVGVANYYFYGYSKKYEQYSPNGEHGIGTGPLGKNWTCPSLGPHNFRLEWNSTDVRVYVDDVLKIDDFPNYYGFPKIILQTETGPGYRIAAAWDNITGDRVFSGIFTSSIHDTKAAEPMLMNLNWNATTPEGTTLSVAVRSSDNPFMQNPSPWTMVNNGQDSGLPAIKRYLQYQASFNSTGGALTPILHDMAINYLRRIVKVETSIDGKSTWTPANGTETWIANLTLPENTTVIWVRATCGAGDYIYTNITVDVDTTPPVGSILINNGDEYTTVPDVTLALNASDRYGIVSMMISEDPEFKAAIWREYAQSQAFSFSPEGGKRTIYAKFKDGSGLESVTVKDSIIFDIGLPTGTVIINGGDQYTNSTLVRLSIEAFDREGVVKMILSNNANSSGTDWSDYQTSISWSLLPGNGERSVYAKFKDGSGQESEFVEDSIIVDTIPPSGNVLLDEGSPYTRSPNIIVKLDIKDDTGIPMMTMSEFPTFIGSGWEPYRFNIPWNLSGTDGTKTIYCRVQDMAGNIGELASDSIILDSSPPVSAISGLPSIVDVPNITVFWSGSDAQSGIKYYDVQVRDGSSAWTDWLMEINFTNGTFLGQDGHNYYFRVRAMDMAGNLQGYPDNGSGPVSMQIPVLPPLVHILKPLQNSTVNGIISVEGTVDHPQPWKTIIGVFVKVDDGAWQKANGTNQWSFQWDTNKEKNGVHMLKVKAFDGQIYSPEENRTVTVWNIHVDVSTDSSPYPMLIMVIILTVVAVWLIRSFVRRRFSGGESSRHP